MGLVGWSLYSYYFRQKKKEIIIFFYTRMSLTGLRAPILEARLGLTENINDTISKKGFWNYPLAPFELPVACERSLV